MNFTLNNLHDFMTMGQHGFYVWSAWFITLFAIVFLIAQSRHVRRRFFRDGLAKIHIQQLRAEQLKRESRQ